MSNHEANLDPLTTSLLAFISPMREELEERSLRIFDELTYRLRSKLSNKLSRTKAFKLLKDTADKAEQRIEKICRKYSVDFLLAYVRRLPCVLRH